MDAGLGFLFGVARGVLLVVVAFIALRPRRGIGAGGDGGPKASAQVFLAICKDRVEAEIPVGRAGLGAGALRAAGRTCVTRRPVTR